MSLPKEPGNYGPEPDTISYLIKKRCQVKEVQVEIGERTAGKSIT